MKPVKNKFYSWKPNRASEYLSLQEAWLLSIGGSTTGKRFKIRETGRNTLGWRNSWPRQMDDTVGRVVRATGEPNGDDGDDGDVGISCDNGFSYPFWVLEVVNETS
jgi:hypothetical protein